MRSIADTLAVSAAGAISGPAQAAEQAYAGNGPKAWSGAPTESYEAAAFVNAVAAHALDFDDVHLQSSIHPSVVLLPAILTGPEKLQDDRLIAAMQAGLLTAAALSDLLGAGHYHRGWHGTGTIGAFAATAAVGWLEGLDGRQMRSAFALAAAMSGGVQANFGTGAKPAQAGFAAVAGRRAARLAKAGLDGPPDVFGTGFAALYGAPDGLAGRGAMPDPSRWRTAAKGIAIKLYPCCFAATRLIGVALDARDALGPVFGDTNLSIQVTVPKGSVAVLRYDQPRTGAQAKFSGPFCTAAALLDGPPKLPHFDRSPIEHPEILALAERIVVVEDPTLDSHGDIRAGTVFLEVRRNGDLLGCWERGAIPGTPEDPPGRKAVTEKVAGCLDVWMAATGRPWPGFDLLSPDSDVRGWLPMDIGMS